MLILPAASPALYGTTGEVGNGPRVIKDAALCISGQPQDLLEEANITHEAPAAGSSATIIR